MAALQNVTMQDRTATPIVYTFVPRSLTDGVASLVVAGSVPIGEKTFSLSKRSTASGRHKITQKFVFPVVQTETINGVARPVVVDTDYVTLVYDFGPTSDTARRNNVQGMVEDSQKTTKALVVASVRDLETVWG